MIQLSIDFDWVYGHLWENFYSERGSFIINAAMPWFIITFSFITTLTPHGSYVCYCYCYCCKIQKFGHHDLHVITGVVHSQKSWIICLTEVNFHEYLMCLTKKSTLCQADNTRSEPLLVINSWGIYPINFITVSSPARLSCCIVLRG